MCVEGVFSGEHARQLHMVICEHLFRKGKLDVAERIIKVNISDNKVYLSFQKLSPSPSYYTQQ